MKGTLILTIIFFIFNIAFGQVLFQDDFGTSFSSISTTNWPCKSSSPSFNSSSGTCMSFTDRGVILNSSQYLTTRGITIPASGATLTFEYSYSGSYAFPTVQIGTGGFSCASATYTTIQTLTTTSTCSTVSIDLSAYAGQTIYIRFQAGWTSTYNFELDNVVVTGGSGGGGSASCGNCSFGTNCFNSTANGSWTSCNTWENGNFCIVWTTFQMRNRAPIINNNVTVSGFISSNMRNCKSIYINPGATLTFSTSYQGNTLGTYTIEVCGTLNINSGFVDFSNFDLIINNGGVVNMNGGTFRVKSILIKNGGTLNLNGGDLQRACDSYTSVGLEIQQGGTMNINSSSARFSNFSCFTTPYTILDGTIDCKNSLNSWNYTNIKLGNVRVSNNTSTGRIRTQTAFVPMAEWNRSAGNNFWGFNSDFGGTVEYYGNSSIYLQLSSRYEYYDLEINNTGGLYLYRETDVTGILYLKKGNIYINGKRLVLHGKINYTTPYAINGTAPNSTLEILGKIPSVKDAGLSTYLISSQGTNNINIRNLTLRFTGTNYSIDTLRLFREDVVILQSPLTITGQLQLDRGILRTSNTNYPKIINTSPTAVRHKTKGYRTLYSFISGPLLRNMSVGNSYDFPVGYPNMTEYFQNWDVTQPLPLHRLLTIDFKSKTNNPTTETGLLVSFAPSIPTCSGALVNAIELTGETYTQLHPEGKWIVNVTPPEPGEIYNYDIKLYTWGFDAPALQDNLYAPLKRPDGSTSCADWTTANGSLGTPNQLGRIIITTTAGMDTSFAIRKNLSQFSEFAIGIMDANTLPAINLTAKKINNNNFILNVNIIPNTIILVKNMKNKIIHTLTPDENGNAYLKISENVLVQAQNENNYSNSIFLKFVPQQKNNDLWIYNNNLFIETSAPSTLIITNTLGQIIYKTSIPEGKHNINLKEILNKNGLYFITISNAFTRKTVKYSTY